MSFFATITEAPAAKTSNTSVLALSLAVIFTGMATAQLFSYEKFPDVLRSMWLPGGAKMAAILASLLVVFEIFALPFLLRMRVSPLMRLFSMIFSWLVITLWICLTLWQNVSINSIGNAGIFGATLTVPTGWWAMLVFVALGILVGWVSWGMWPLRDKKK